MQIFITVDVLVHNIAVEGFNLENSLFTLEKHVSAINPDVIIFESAKMIGQV